MGKEALGFGVAKIAGWWHIQDQILTQFSFPVTTSPTVWLEKVSHLTGDCYLG